MALNAARGRETDFIPLLFAADINVYSVARAFHEQYGVVSHARGKALAGPCSDSRIVDYRRVPNVDQSETLLETVNDFARSHADQKILVIGCGDSYVRSIGASKSRFEPNVVAPYIDAERMDRLIHKEHFYALCRESGVDYPETFVHRAALGRTYELPFREPFIIKPSNGIRYWECPFEGQDKVFKARTRADADAILERIYAAGYDDSVIIQNYIPGDDTYMRVLTNYSDRNGAVKLSCMGHVLLEEHTPHGIGNHAVILTERDETVESQIARLLDGMKYTGFSNFDIKYDRRDGKYKVFELNARQGRSNYYVTGAGENIARLLVDDLILGKELPFRSVASRSMWTVVPRGVAFKYVRQAEYRSAMRALIREGRCVNPLLYARDRGPARGIRIAKNLLSHYYKFKKYYGKPQD